MSDFMYDFSRGDRLLKFVRLFLENGFDVNGNNGRNGALCLHELCWSTYDEYILQIAEVLLVKVLIAHCHTMKMKKVRLEYLIQ